jgi:hypothetical protein
MTLITLGTWYLYAGGAVALLFILFGLGRLDENAQGAWIFRPLLIPGAMLIWPLVIWRCVVLWRGEEKLDRHRMPRKGQERMALTFICAIPVIIVLAIALRQDPDTLAQPVLLEAAK